MIRRIIICDDSAIARRVIKLAFEGVFYDIREIDNAFDLLEQYEDINPDIIFLDLNMPNMNGYNAVKIIRRNHPDMRIVITTSDTDKATVIKLLKENIWRYVAKPIDIKYIKNLIADYERECEKCYG